MFDNLSCYTLPVQKLVDRPIAVGLWLPQAVIEEIGARPGSITELKSRLEEAQLLCYTLNAFPYGNFHGERVKEQVYLPDWTDRRRLDYTQRCATVLSGLLPDGFEGSISTLPLGFKRLSHDPKFMEQTHSLLLELLFHLDELHDSTGRVIRLAVEPEPLCVLETTDEAISWYTSLRVAAERTGQLELLERHIGLCLDICHQAVEFEDLSESISKLTTAGLRINKVHLSSALELINPAGNEAGLVELARFQEPRYLHQTMLMTPGRPLERIEDLTPETIAQLAAQTEVTSSRIHFHVPVHQATMGALGTTQSQLRDALEAVKALDYPPHLEIETYTWSVMKPADESAIINGISAEFAYIHQELQAIEHPKPKFISLL